MTFYFAYVDEVVQRKVIHLLVTFSVSYLLDKSLKSHCVLGLIPSCYVLSPDSLLPPSSLPALSCCQTVHIWPFNIALGLTYFFSGPSMLFKASLFFFFYLFFLYSSLSFSSLPSLLSFFLRRWLSGGLGIPQGLGYVVLDQLHYLNHHPPHRGSEPLGCRWQAHCGHHVRRWPPQSLCPWRVSGVRTNTLFHILTLCIQNYA